MAFVKVKGRGVADVADARCGPHLSCFFPNEDKGTFVAGRGYTSYYDRPKLVCWTRHVRGCPVIAVCATCQHCLAPYTGGICDRCGK